MPLRVAMIVGTFPAASQVFALNQIVGLTSRGHSVDIYAHYHDGRPPHPDILRHNLLARTSYASAGPGRVSLRAIATIGTFLRRAPYDVVHCQFGVLGRRYRALRRLGLCRAFVTSFRGMDLSAFIRRKGTGVYRGLFATGDLFLPNCDFFRARLIELGCDPKRLAVVRSGIDLARFSFRARTPPVSGPIRIISAGRLVAKKGIERGLAAVAAVAARSGREIDYTIIGDGPLRAELQARIGPLGLEGRARILDWVSQDQLVEAFHASHIFLAPNVTGPDGDVDGPANALKEAIATGMPVVSSDAGGMRELVVDGVTGYLTPAGDDRALAAKLASLVDHPEAWGPMGTAGRQHVADAYDIDRLNELLVALYGRALGGTPPLA